MLWVSLTPNITPKVLPATNPNFVGCTNTYQYMLSVYHCNRYNLGVRMVNGILAHDPHIRPLRFANIVNRYGPAWHTSSWWASTHHYREEICMALQLQRCLHTCTSTCLWPFFLWMFLCQVALVTISVGGIVYGHSRYLLFTSFSKMK